MEMQAQKVHYIGVGVRFVALLIDMFICGIVGAALAWLTHTPLPLKATSVFGLPMYVSSPIVAILVILPWLYFTVMEAVWGGTVGKLALGLRVTALDGRPISWRQSIVRNLLRIIDNLAGYFVGAIFIWNSPLCQRLGDRVAKTVVVRR